jgi:hypothetical protein
MVQSSRIFVLYDGLWILCHILVGSYVLTPDLCIPCDTVYTVLRIGAAVIPRCQ